MELDSLGLTEAKVINRDQIRRVCCEGPYIQFAGSGVYLIQMTLAVLRLDRCHCCGCLLKLKLQPEDR